jgi:hypothetical protein
VEGDAAMGWKKGDLVVHLAGCWVADKCDERWKEFWQKRETVNTKKIVDTNEKADIEETVDTTDTTEIIDSA